MTPVGATVNAALSMVITPLGCGSSAAPVMSIVACVVPRTLVSAVVIPCTSASSIGVLWMCRSNASSFAAGASRCAPGVAAFLKAATGT